MKLLCGAARDLYGALGMLLKQRNNTITFNVICGAAWVAEIAQAFAMARWTQGFEQIAEATAS